MSDDELYFGPPTDYQKTVRNEQAPLYRRFVAWIVVGSILLVVFSAGILILLFVLDVDVFPEEAVLGKELVISKNAFGKRERVFYENDATEDDARRLGRFLQEIGYFQGHAKADAVLAIADNTVTISFPLERGWDDAETIAVFESLLPDLSRDLFAGRPVQIQLCLPKATRDRWDRWHLTVKKVIK